MKHIALILGLFAAPLFAGDDDPVATAVNGNTFFSGGGSAVTVGKNTFFSDGESATTVGKNTFFSDGTVATRVGKNTFYSDRGSSTTVGKNTFYDDGTVATRVGKNTFVDAEDICGADRALKAVAIPALSNRETKEDDWMIKRDSGDSALERLRRITDWVNE